MALFMATFSTRFCLQPIPVLSLSASATLPTFSLSFMLGGLIMHPEHDQQTSEPSLSWASEKEELQIHGGNRNWGEKSLQKNPQNEKKDELISIAVASDLPRGWGTPQ